MESFGSKSLVVTCEVECPQVSEELVLMVHASKDVHDVINHGHGMTLATAWEDSKSWDCRPSVGLGVVAPNVVVVVFVIGTSKAVDKEFVVIDQ